MNIRMAQRSDHEQWLVLWRAYQAFYKVDIAPQVTAVTWARLLNQQEPMHCALAEIDGVIVGIVHFIFHRSTWTVGDYVYLQDLFTTPEARGKGVGRALIEHVYASAEHDEAARVWWLTHETNTQAMSLYDRIADKSGFVQYRKVMG